MPVDAKVCRVFLASPSGLEAERKLVRDAIDEFNRQFAIASNILFLAYGWEDEPPGAGRPQSLINQHVEECDLFILMLCDRWGTPPGGNSYQSGTEEEYSLAHQYLKSPNHALGDIAIYFKTIDPAKLSHPDPQLQRVQEFKQQLEDEKDIFYVPFDNHLILHTLLFRRFAHWLSRCRGDNSPTVEASTAAVNHTDFTQDTLQDIPTTRRGKEQIEQVLREIREGHFVKAETLLAQADPTDIGVLIEHGDLLVKFGRRTDAIRIYDKAKTLANSLKDESLLAHVLSRLGTAYSNELTQEALDKALHLLYESLRLSHQQDNETLTAANLHNIAHVYDKLFENTRTQDKTKAKQFLEKAEHFLRDALKINEKQNRSIGIGRNLGHLAKVLLFLGRLDEAEIFCKREISLYESMNDHARLAAAHTHLGRVKQAKEEVDAAIQEYKYGLGLFERLLEKSDFALDMAEIYSYLGSLHFKKKEYMEAEKSAKRSIAIYMQLNNALGMATGYANISMIHTELENFDQAETYARESIRLAELSSDVPALATAYYAVTRATRRVGKLPNEERERCKTYARKAVSLYRQAGDTGMATYIENVLTQF